MIGFLCKFIVFVEIVAAAIGLGFLLGKRSQNQQRSRRRPDVRTREGQTLAVAADYAVVPEVIPVKQLKRRPA